MRIYEDLQYCDDHSNSLYVDIDSSCEHAKANFYPNSVTKETHLFANKMSNAVSGTGWQCEMEEIKYSFSESYLKEKIIQHQSQLLKSLQQKIVAIWWQLKNVLKNQ